MAAMVRISPADGRAGRAGAPLKVVNDQVGSPTYTEDLAAATLDLIERDATGIWHLTNCGQTNWFEFAKATLEEFEVKRKSANDDCRVVQDPPDIRRPPVLQRAGCRAVRKEGRKTHAAMARSLERVRHYGWKKRICLKQGGTGGPPVVAVLRDILSAESQTCSKLISPVFEPLEPENTGRKRPG